MFRVWGLGSNRRSHSMEVFRESAKIEKHWLRFDQPKVGWTNSIRVASIRKTLENFIFGYCKQLDQGLWNSVYNMIYAHMIWLWSLVSPTSLWPLLQMFGSFVVISGRPSLAKWELTVWNYKVDGTTNQVADLRLVGQENIFVIYCTLHVLNILRIEWMDGKNGWIDGCIE